jgi:hypothetical protein
MPWEQVTEPFFENGTIQPGLGGLPSGPAFYSETVIGQFTAGETWPIR